MKFYSQQVHVQLERSGLAVCFVVKVMKYHDLHLQLQHANIYTKSKRKYLLQFCWKPSEDSDVIFVLFIAIFIEKDYELLWKMKPLIDINWQYLTSIDHWTKGIWHNCEVRTDVALWSFKNPCFRIWRNGLVTAFKLNKRY